MRFERQQRYGPRPLTDRQRAAYARKLAKEQARYPLFADHVAAEQRPLDQEIKRREERATRWSPIGASSWRTCGAERVQPTSRSRKKSACGSGKSGAPGPVRAPPPISLPWSMSKVGNRRGDLPASRRSSPRPGSASGARFAPSVLPRWIYKRAAPAYAGASPHLAAFPVLLRAPQNATASGPHAQPARIAA